MLTSPLFAYRMSGCSTLVVSRQPPAAATVVARRDAAVSTGRLFAVSVAGIVVRTPVQSHSFIGLSGLSRQGDFCDPLDSLLTPAESRMGLPPRGSPGQ